MRDDGSDLCVSDLRQLTPRQWVALKIRVNARANKERRQVIRQMAQAMRTVISRVGRAAIRSNATRLSYSHQCLSARTR